MSVNDDSTRVSHAIVKKNMVRYMTPHAQVAQCSYENAVRTQDCARQAEIEGKCFSYSSLNAVLAPLNRNILFLYTCIQNPRLRTVYRQRKWPLLAPVRKIMALERKKWPLGVK